MICGANLRNERKRDSLARPSLVKDFTVSIKNKNGEYETVKAVTDNYQRFLEIDLGDITTDSLKINFTATNGLPYVSVFDVRVY